MNRPSLSYYYSGIAKNHPSVARLGSTCSIMFEPRIQYRGLERGSSCIVVNFNQTSYRYCCLVTS